MASLIALDGLQQMDGFHIFTLMGGFFSEEHFVDSSYFFLINDSFTSQFNGFDQYRSSGLTPDMNKAFHLDLSFLEVANPIDQTRLLL